MTRPTIRRTTDEQLSDTVIDAVSAATDTDPQELPRLSRVIDLDALDRLYRHDDGDRDSCSRIEFTVAGCDVQVTTDGRVDVVPSESESRRTST